MSMKTRSASVVGVGLLLMAGVWSPGCAVQDQKPPVSLRLSNQTSFVVDPNVSVDGVKLEDLGGSGAPFPVLMAGEAIAKEIPCRPGLRLTIVSPEFTLPNTLSGAVAEGAEVVEGVNFSCGSTVEVLYSQSGTGQFAVEVRIVN